MYMCILVILRMELRICMFIYVCTYRYIHIHYLRENFRLYIYLLVFMLSSCCTSLRNILLGMILGCRNGRNACDTREGQEERQRIRIPQRKYMGRVRNTTRQIFHPESIVCREISKQSQRVVCDSIRTGWKANDEMENRVRGRKSLHDAGALLDRELQNRWVCRIQRKILGNKEGDKVTDGKEKDLVRAGWHCDNGICGRVSK